MKVVLDTNVLVSAFLSPYGVPARILKYLEQEAFELLLSEEILEEYKDAFRYDEVKKAHKLTNEQITRVLDDLRVSAKVMKPTVSVSVVASDPDDNKLFACALAGGADFIISGDTTVQAVKHYREIQVLSPKLFLVVLEQKA
jgi:putative PIN family toxin of toxin-antitoxin system